MARCWRPSWPSLALTLIAVALHTNFVTSGGEGLADKVVFAINAGGEAHVDVYGIRYSKDPLRTVGTASDYGKQLQIGRVPQQDQILYQTERYHTATFGYDIPVYDDGWYLLVLKFSEVYFNAPNMKVFDVVLNGDLTIASDLDVYERVGRGVAHDEYIEFEVKSGKILYNEDETEITRGKMRVEFIKTYRDNPKVNAIILVKGKLNDWPQLPALPDPEEEDDTLEDEDLDSMDGDGSPRRQGGGQHQPRNPSGPKARDPYENDDSTAMLPIFVAIGAFIPLVFCMCRL